MPDSPTILDSLSRLIADAERFAGNAAARLADAESSLRSALRLIEGILASSDLAAEMRDQLGQARDALLVSLQAVAAGGGPVFEAAPVVGDARAASVTEAIEPLNLAGVAVMLVGDDGGFDPQMLDDMRAAGARVEQVGDVANAVDRATDAELTAVFLDTLAPAMRSDPAAVIGHIRRLCDAAADNTLLVAFCDTPPTADPEMRELSSLSRLSWWSFPSSIDVVVRKLSHRHADLRRQTPTGMVMVGERRRLTRTVTADPTRGVSPPTELVAPAKRIEMVPPTPLPAEVSTSRTAPVVAASTASAVSTSASASTSTSTSASTSAPTTKPRSIRRPAREVGTSAHGSSQLSAPRNSPPARPSVFESAIPTPSPESVARVVSVATTGEDESPGSEGAYNSHRRPTPATIVVEDPTALFDFDTAIATTGGDRSFFRSIIELFLLNELGLWTRINDAVAANDSAALLLATQAYTSALNNLAATRALKLTADLETLARTDELRSAGRVLSQLDRERKLLRHALETYLSRRSS